MVLFKDKPFHDFIKNMGHCFSIIRPGMVSKFNFFTGLLGGYVFFCEILNYFSQKMDMAFNKEALFIRLLLKNDKQAFSIFFDHYYPKMIRLALIYLPGYQNAEDVVSDVLVKLLKQKTQLSDIQNFEAYLYTAVKNEALNLLKSKRLKHAYTSYEDQSDFLTSDFTDPYEVYVANELSELTFNTIEKLPPKRKLVYKFIKDDGLKYKEVAELLEISERTVEAHLKLAVKEIRQVVKQYLKGKKSDKKIMRIAKTVLPILLSMP